jgi:hypothetical protein
MHTDDFQTCFVKSSGFHEPWAQGDELPFAVDLAVIAYIA